MSATLNQIPEEGKRPWHVRLTDGTFHSGHMTEGLAQARCDRANKDAAALGIKARYEVKENAEGVAA